MAALNPILVVATRDVDEMELRQMRHLHGNNVEVTKKENLEGQTFQEFLEANNNIRVYVDADEVDWLPAASSAAKTFGLLKRGPEGTAVYHVDHGRPIKMT